MTNAAINLELDCNFELYFLTSLPRTFGYGILVTLFLIWSFSLNLFLQITKIFSRDKVLRIGPTVRSMNSGKDSTGSSISAVVVMMITRVLLTKSSQANNLHEPNAFDGFSSPGHKRRALKISQGIRKCFDASIVYSD